jgi:hypothetical protein
MVPAGTGRGPLAPAQVAAGEPVLLTHQPAVAVRHGSVLSNDSRRVRLFAVLDQLAYSTQCAITMRHHHPLSNRFRSARIRSPTRSPGPIHFPCGEGAVRGHLHPRGPEAHQGLILTGSVGRQGNPLRQAAHPTFAQRPANSRRAVLRHAFWLSTRRSHPARAPPGRQHGARTMPMLAHWIQVHRSPATSVAVVTRLRSACPCASLWPGNVVHVGNNFWRHDGRRCRRGLTSGHGGGGLHDDLGDRGGLGDIYGVARRNLHHGRASTGRHHSLCRRGDHSVLRRHQVPARL